MEDHTTLKRLKQRIEESKKEKTKNQKRQDKIKKLQDRTGGSDELWSGLENVDHSHLSEDISGLNRAYMKFRSLYQPGRKFSCKEWIEVMADLLDEVE